MAPFEASTCPRPSASSSASRKGLLVDAFTSSRAHHGHNGGGRTKPRHLHHHACRHGRTLVRWLNEPWPLYRGRGRTRRRLAASTITNGASGHAELADFALPFAYGGGFRVALETRIVVDGEVSRMSRIEWSLHRLSVICTGSAARPLPLGHSKKSLSSLLFSFESACFSAPYPPKNATGPTPRDRRCSVTPHQPLNASLYWRRMKATQTEAP